MDADPLTENDLVITGVFYTPDHFSYMVPVTPYIIVTQDCFNKEGLDATITFNDITLSENTFDGKFFAGRSIQLSGVAAEEGKAVVGWKIDKDGSVSEETGATLNIEMPSCKKLAITPIIGDGDSSGIRELAVEGQDVKAIYNLQGIQQKALQKGVNIIVYGNGQSQKLLVK